MEPLQTRERLLHAAEHFYAEQGFEGTSLRDLTSSAGANLAAVNYHFGSKKALLMEMCRVRIVPINQERQERLAKAREAAAPAPIPLREIFEAFLRPLAKPAIQDGKPNIPFLRMVGRLISESDDFLEDMVNEFFQELLQDFVGELARTLPNLPPEELHWRFHFAVSTMVGSLAQYHRLGQGACALHDTADIDGMIDRLRDFTCGGFAAPCATNKEGKA